MKKVLSAALVAFLFTPLSIAWGAVTYVRAVYDNRGDFSLEEIPAGRRLLSAPSCLSATVVERYPDIPRRLEETVACANKHMRAYILEEKIVAMQESIDILDRNILLLNQSAEALKQVPDLPSMGAGVVMPVGVLTEKYHAGAVFKGMCVVGPNEPAENGAAVGPLNSRFSKTDRVFVATTGKIQTHLRTALPELFGELGKLINEPEPSKIKIGYYATRVTLSFSDYMVVGKQFYDRVFPNDQNAVIIAMTEHPVPAGKKECKAPKKYYEISLGAQTLQACFDTRDIPVVGDLSTMAKKKAAERITELQVKKRNFASAKKTFEAQLVAHKRENAGCFGG